MTDPQIQAAKNAKQLHILGWVISATLIGNFLWRALTTANEYPGRTAQVMEITLDLFMVVGLFGIRKHIPQAVWWLALVAGIGLFAIRMHSDASWWTGHWNYSIR